MKELYPVVLAPCVEETIFASLSKINIFIGVYFCVSTLLLIYLFFHQYHTTLILEEKL